MRDQADTTGGSTVTAAQLQTATGTDSAHGHHHHHDHDRDLPRWDEGNLIDAADVDHPVRLDRQHVIDRLHDCEQQRSDRQHREGSGCAYPSAGTEFLVRCDRERNRKRQLDEQHRRLIGKDSKTPAGRFTRNRPPPRSSACL
jgi:hypothetical protein